MKRFILFLLLTCVPAVTAFAAQPGGIGLGVILGEPTGVSFKTWIGERTAIDAAAAWSFSDHTSFQFHADYLIHPFPMPKPRDVRGPILFYYGFGGLIDVRGGTGSHRDETVVGARFPLGFSHLLVSAPVEFFAEIAPVLDLAPSTKADLNAAIGARYYFK